MIKRGFQTVLRGVFHVILIRNQSRLLKRNICIGRWNMKSILKSLILIILFFTLFSGMNVVCTFASDIPDTSAISDDNIDTVVLSETKDEF